MTEYNSQGALQTNSSQFSKLSKAYDVYNHNIRAQNIQNLQQNPNQKRVLNPPNKMYGNLAALSGLQKKSSHSNKQTYQPTYYQNQGSTSTGKQSQLNKVIKGMVSSNTSRVGSRDESRNGVHGAKTSDQRFIQANLNNIAVQDMKSGTQNLTLQQMKNNFIKNQQMLVSNQNFINTDSQRPVSQIETHNPTNLFMDISKGGYPMDANHSQSNINNSSSFQSQYQNLSQQKNINSYEMRKHSLQDIKMRGIPTAHKFRNQAQNLSSDQDRFISDESLINSMSLNQRAQSQNRNKTQEAKTQVLQYSDGTADLVIKKIQKEFSEQIKAIGQSLSKIERSGVEVKAEAKEDGLLVKAVEGVISKLNMVQMQFGQQDKAVKLDTQMQEVSKLFHQARVLKGLCHLDVGLNYECIQEIKKISEIQNFLAVVKNETTLTSDQLLAINMQSENVTDLSTQPYLRHALLIMSIAQHRMGEHQDSLDTVSQCINQFPDFKDAYLVRGQKYLLQKKPQNALQDFLKFDKMVMTEYHEAIKVGTQTPIAIAYFSFQVCVSKESIGDAYKKIKQYKQAAKYFQDSLNEVQSLIKNNPKQTEFGRRMLDKLIHHQCKIKMKIAMCCYYQGQVKKAMHIFEELLQYYNKFDPTEIKTQQKTIKNHFYHAKALLALKEKDTTNSVKYMGALKSLTFCTNEEIDPELHELYSGNAHFEIFKMFIKQKDILNAHDYLQKATDNNFSSKRLSLYRDFTEGVVYLMKRKIKKGVQILSDLLEVVINGQKEIEKKEKEKEDASGEKAQGRYNIEESEAQIELPKNDESIADEKATINSKANQIASGRFTKEMYEFLIFNIYIYRSYGYVAIEKYEHALEDLQKAKKINPKLIDRATIYNKWLSRGILKMDTEEYLMASKYFGKACIRFPDNKDSFCLNVISIVRSYSFSMLTMYMDSLQKQEKILQTKQFLNVAIDCCCKNEKQPSLYFFRGLLNYQLHYFYEALNDFNVAIAEEEEPTGQFHLARGRCYACLSILDEAMKDLSIALELDETLHEAYIYRGKCAYLLGDNNLAFHDFQKLIISDQKNPLVHIYAGNLLMTTGAYTDAIKAFDNADTVQPTPFASFQRIRCYCALSNLEFAFEQMQLCMHHSQSEKFMTYDFKVLLQLLSAVRSFAFSKGENNEPDEKGIKEQMDILKNCIQQITQIIDVFEKGEHLAIKKDESPMTIQIIPNVGRIKIEKQLVINKLQPHKEGIPQYTPLTKQEQKQLEGIPMYGYYRENIFQLEEMYLYRSIFHLYRQSYKEALQDMQRAWKLHFQQKKTDHDSKKGGDPESEHMFGKYSMSQLVSPMDSLRSYNNSQNTDLSEVGLCSLNVSEYQLNQLIIYIQMGDWSEALKRASELLMMNPQSSDFSKSIKQLLLVRAMIYLEMGQTDKHNHDMTLYLKNFNQIVKNKQGAVILEPFDTKGRICHSFEHIVLGFKKSPKGTKGSFEIWIRPSFSMPFIKPPNMIPNINEEIIQSEFNLKQIDAPMPEAPWNHSCVDRNNFQPQNFLYEVSPRWTQKSNNYPKLPQQNQQFLATYFQRDTHLLFDAKVMEDIDDLSDTEKVSLISDIELGDDQLEDRSGSALDTTKEVLSQALDGGDKLNMNLLQVQKLNLQASKQSKSVARVNNGIQLSKAKYKCVHTKTCESCHLTDAEVFNIQITNQDELIDYLKLGPEEKRAKKEAVKKQLAQAEAIEDTVSEDEYGSSEDEESKKGEKDSKYSHSRFSSQIPDDLEEMVQLPDQDIDAQDIEIKKLNPDKRNLLQKEKVKNVQSKQFRDDIDSIQNRADIKDIIQPTPENQSSPVSKPRKPSQPGKQTDQSTESMVLVGSKNMGKGVKKKTTGKKLGIGNLNIHNLKKNKLAIAFNNMENEKAGSESEQ